MDTNMADRLRKWISFTFISVCFILTCSVSNAVLPQTNLIEKCGKNTTNNDTNTCTSYLQTHDGLRCQTSCCGGWKADDDGKCTIFEGLPPDYQKPTITNCPKQGLQHMVEIHQFANVGYLSRWIFHAVDYKGDLLSVGLSKSNFSHCKCSFPYENVTAFTEKDAYGYQAVCIFTVFIKDSFQPRFKYCPGDQHHTNQDLITWDAPEVEDNVGVRFLFGPDRLNNTKFSAGRYQLFYNATDYSRNTASCSFTVTVKNLELVCDCDNNSSTSPYLVSTIAGAFLIVFIALALAVFGIFRRYRRHRQQNRHHQHHHNHRMNIHPQPPPYEPSYDDHYQMYESIPPPYDVITQNKPPDYSPSFDPPPYTESCDNVVSFGESSISSISSPRTFDNQTNLISTNQISVQAEPNSISSVSHPVCSETIV